MTQHEDIVVEDFEVVVAGARLAALFGDWSIEDELAGIHCPVLLLQGDRDEYATPDHLDAIASRIPGEFRSVLLTGCGHPPHLQARHALMAEVVRLVASLA